MRDPLYELEMARAELAEERRQQRDSEVIRHLERNVAYWTAKVDDETEQEAKVPPLRSSL